MDSRGWTAGRQGGRGSEVAIGVDDGEAASGLAGWRRGLVSQQRLERRGFCRFGSSAHPAAQVGRFATYRLSEQAQLKLPLTRIE